MNPQCLDLLNELSAPLEKLTTILNLTPVLDDAAIARNRLLVLMSIASDYAQELVELIDAASCEQSHQPVVHRLADDLDVTVCARCHVVLTGDKISGSCGGPRP
jgi:hypothetical protein